MIVRDLFTGIDGVSHDIGRYATAAAFATGLSLQVYVVVVRGQAFDMQAFGLGIGALAAGMGAMLGLKAKTEPGGAA